MLGDRIADRLDILIDDYDLHSSIPVSLAPLEPLYVPVYRDLDHVGLAGTAILPKGVITAKNFAQVLLHSGLSDYDARIVYAHEVGHCILGHEGQLRLAGMDEWFADKMEREAWEVAARLLVPIGAILEYGEIDRIAAACEVPPHLVRMAL